MKPWGRQFCLEPQSSAERIFLCLNLTPLLSVSLIRSVWSFLGRVVKYAAHNVSCDGGWSQTTDSVLRVFYSVKTDSLRPSPSKRRFWPTITVNKGENGITFLPLDRLN